MTKDWPWDQEPNCAVITERAVIVHGKPILLVSHDLDDHGWQFLAGGEPNVDDAMIVCLSHIPECDPSIVQLASMAPGYVAWRETAASPWVIERNPRQEEVEEPEQDEQASEDEVIVPNFQYKCSKCEKIHDGFPVYRFTNPEAYLAVPEAERACRCVTSDDFCVIDNQSYFVRCDVELSVIGTSETLILSVWGSLSKENFDLYKTHFNDERRDHLGPFFSWFSSRLSPDEYPETVSLECVMHIRNKGHKPLLLAQSDDHPLALEQREGIPFAKALRLVEPFITWHSLA